MQRVAHVVGILGAPLTGKGLYAKEWIARPCEGRRLVWSAIEKSDNYAGHLDTAHRPSSIPALVDAIKAGARDVVYLPPEDRDAMLADFTDFCRVVWACPGARVLVEELSRVTSPSWAPPAWRNLTTAGSHQGIELAATAQRPAQVDKDFLGGCTELRCYRMNERPDAERVASTIVEFTWQDFMALEDRNFIHLWRSPRKIERGIQALPGIPSPRPAGRARGADQDKAGTRKPGGRSARPAR